jgi:hypothetical protein
MFVSPNNCLRFPLISSCKYYSLQSLYTNIFSQSFKIQSLQFYICKFLFLKHHVYVCYVYHIIFFFSPGATEPIVGVYFTALYRALASSLTMLLDHTQRRATFGRTPLHEWSVRRRDLYLTTHNTHNRQTSMPRVAFEPTISAGEYHIIFFFSPGATEPIVGVYFTAVYRTSASSRTRLLDHTQRRATVGSTPMNEWSIRRRDLYLTTHNNHNRQTPMPRVRFEPTIAGVERP